MPTTGTPIPTRIAGTAADPFAKRRAEIAWPIHVAAAAWVVAMLGLAHLAPLVYTPLVQEDRFIEWATVGLFLAAALIRVRGALPQRRIFDLLIAAFCLFVAGEEFSWGQRLLGLTPPAIFLAHNTQQELTLHNFTALFGQPKGVLMLALAGFGVLLPPLTRLRPGTHLLARIGATPPTLALLPHFLAAVSLLYWYPVEFTGEWVEALAGALFLVSAPSPRWASARGVAVSALAAVLLTLWSAHDSRASPAALACARKEGEALLADLVDGAAATGLILRSGAVHKRVWTALQDGYLHGDRLLYFQHASCSQSSAYFIDPWGMAYWVRATSISDRERLLTVYSMGPNRRRDHNVGEPNIGDDIVVSRAVDR